MANDYTGSYSGISATGEMRAVDMTNALNLMEKVANKVSDLSSSPTNSDAYPTAKAVYDKARLGNFESTNNKVQNISASFLSQEYYPSTKAFYDALVDLKTWLDAGGAV